MQKLSRTLLGSPQGRDLLRPVFLTRSGGMHIEAGELAEAEVELEVIEPWDTGVNMFSAELLGKVLVGCAQVLHVGSVVVGDDDGVVRHPHVSVQSEEASVGEVAGIPCRHGVPESCTPLVDDRLGEERHGPMAIADVEVVRTSPMPAEGLIGIEKRLNVPAFGIVTGESVGCIGVSRGQECLESPIVWMLPQALHELKKGLRLRVGELEGQLGSS